VKLWNQDLDQEKEKTARLFLTEYLKQYNYYYCEAMISTFKEQKIQDYNMRWDFFFFFFFFFLLNTWNNIIYCEAMRSKIQDKENIQDYNETISTVKL